MVRIGKAAATLAAAVIAVLVVTGSTASAHQWGNWSWNRYGSTVTIQVYNYATSSYSNANAAIRDWDSHTILSLPDPGSHTDISVFDGNSGATGWVGLATIVNSNGNYITHAHAQLNTYYGYTGSQATGVYCQEVGHTFGLDHSNDGCMGMGYYNNLTYTVAHNWNDIASMYSGPHLAPSTESRDRIMPVWAYQPRTVAEAVRMGGTVVEATVTGVRAGTDIVTPAAGEEGGAARTPTQSVSFATDQTLKGHVASSFTLARTGGSGMSVAGDPAYRVGQKYLLILAPDKRSDGQRVLLSPEGRYALTESGVRTPSTVPAVASVNGTSYQHLRDLVRSAG
jgi:hypothetical protein